MSTSKLRNLLGGLGVVFTFAAGAASSAVAATSPTSWEGDRPIPTPDQAALAAPALSIAMPLRRATPMYVTGDPGPGGTWSLIGPPSGVQRFEPSVVFD